MSLLNAISISSSGITSQRQRIETIVSNLANARTTRTPQGGPYRRQEVVFETTAVGRTRPFAEELEARVGEPMGVRVSELRVDGQPPQMAYDPDHPDANEQGYVAFPNVNPVEESVNLISAARAFEANVTAVTVSQRLIERSLDLGRL